MAVRSQRFKTAKQEQSMADERSGNCTPRLDLSESRTLESLSVLLKSVGVEPIAFAEKESAAVPSIRSSMCDCVGYEAGRAAVFGRVVRPRNAILLDKFRRGS